MNRFRHLMVIALLAGSMAGLLLFAVRHVTVIPLIALAEGFEETAAHAGHSHAPGAHAHEEAEEWQPAPGFQRTGLTAVVVGVLFLIAFLFAPLVQAIPAAATAPALVLVGAMMLGAVAEVDWKDPEVAIPAFLTVIAIPLTFSIANGLAFGIVSYAALRLLRGHARRADWLLYVLAVLFIARFVYLAKG